MHHMHRYPIPNVITSLAYSCLTGYNKKLSLTVVQPELHQEGFGIISHGNKGYIWLDPCTNTRDTS